MRFSVIIPTWNEGPQIGPSLKRLREISDETHMEIILVDGGSTDKTVEVARDWVDQVRVLGSPNRGAQLHAGGKVATGDLLFFLHADTQPPGNWQERLEKYWLKSHSDPLAATVFSVDYGNHWPFRLVAAGQNWRARWLQIAYGDQGFCVSGDVYAKSGGFPEIPLMEDVGFCRRLRPLGRIEVLPERIRPSARRLRRWGALANSLFNQWLFLRYAAGADPIKLWERYYAKDLQGQTPAPPPPVDPDRHPFAYLRKKKRA
ncbi:MAG: TIGR04283 family arsenosugar biosynthesis glycosyltransferase [Elusimicrobia bacterium]|nr:TIGR04283 family arsenosugar biosynthesis glycosyltransferase [Elusimicrobiota bacterium]